MEFPDFLAEVGGSPDEELGSRFGIRDHGDLLLEARAPEARTILERASFVPHPSGTEGYYHYVPGTVVGIVSAVGEEGKGPDRRFTTRVRLDTYQGKGPNLGVKHVQAPSRALALALGEIAGVTQRTGVSTFFPETPSNVRNTSLNMADGLRRTDFSRYAFSEATPSLMDIPSLRVAVRSLKGELEHYKTDRSLTVLDPMRLALYGTLNALGDTALQGYFENRLYYGDDVATLAQFLLEMIEQRHPDLDRS